MRCYLSHMSCRPLIQLLFAYDISGKSLIVIILYHIEQTGIPVRPEFFTRLQCIVVVVVQEAATAFDIVCNARLCELYTRRVSQADAKPSYAGQIMCRSSININRLFWRCILIWFISHRGGERRGTSGSLKERSTYSLNRCFVSYCILSLSQRKGYCAG